MPPAWAARSRQAQHLFAKVAGSFIAAPGVQNTVDSAHQGTCSMALVHASTVRRSTTIVVVLQEPDPEAAEDGTAFMLYDHGSDIDLR